jgi:hypothetical protein
MKIKTMVAGALVITGISAQAFQGSADDKVSYPQGYRQWVHVSSAVVGPASPIYKRYGGIHHIYANEKAMEGYRTGHFPDGAVIVFDLLETKENAGLTTEGARRFIDVMEKHGRRFAQTGGWGFEEFIADNPTEPTLTAAAKTDCYTCHARQKERDSVFSAFRK